MEAMMKKKIILIMAMVWALVFTAACTKETKDDGEEYVDLKVNKSICNGVVVHAEQNEGYSQLFYYDYKSGGEVFACGQANCSHQITSYGSGKINCNSIIEKEVIYPFIYNRQLYYFIKDNKKTELWKSNTDGTNKEKVTEIDFELNYGDNVLWRNYLYISSYEVKGTEDKKNNSTVKNAESEVYQVDLKTGNVEQITNFGVKADAYCTSIQYFENKIFIHYQSVGKSYSEAGFEDVDAYLKWMTSKDYSYAEDIKKLGKKEEYYIYDIKSKKINKLEIGFQSNFEPYKGIDDMDSYYILCFSNNTIYYLDSVVGNRTIYSYNIQTKKRKEILRKFNMCQFWKDDVIYVTGLEMDEKTKDELIPSEDYSKDPTYYTINTKTGEVVEQDYGQKGKVLYVVDVNDEGLLAYEMDYGQGWNIIDEHRMREIDKNEVKKFKEQ